MSGGPLAIRPFSRPLPLRLRRAVLISGHGFQLKGGSMTTFDNRDKAFEDKFAYDAETAFRIAARRNRLLGLWAAEQIEQIGRAHVCTKVNNEHLVCRLQIEKNMYPQHTTITKR